MPYLSLYRKYRSQSFDDLIGQDHVVRTLQNAIESGRIAHAYLFTGPRGTGKTSSARLLAKALNAEGGPNPNPPEDDPIGQMIAAGNCPDVQEFDAASEAGVDDVRKAIVEDVQYQPMMCRYKVYIIDEVHDLSGKAFDALLKTIEEPPEHVVFILATTEYAKVPATIRSRCQKYEFHRGSLSNLIQRLTYVAEAEGIKIQPAAITAIARMADGAYRDALTLLEQAMLTRDGEITLEHIYDQLGLVSDETVDGLLEAIKQADVPKIIETLSELSRLGRDSRSILDSMLQRLSDLTRAAFGVEIGSQNDAGQEAALHAAGQAFGRDFLLSIRSSLSEAHRVIRDISLPRIWFEAELIRLALASQATTERPKPQTKAAETTTLDTKVQPKTEPVAATPLKSEKVDADDPISVAWQAAVQELSALSKSMAARLADAKIGNSENSVLYLQFSRQMDLEWIKESPKRITAVQEAVQKRLGDAWTVELGVGQRAVIETTQAVELPLEGQKLTETVREIFNAN
jgi:DNA polymerase-3 subunit gamma/tau